MRLLTLLFLLFIPTLLFSQQGAPIIPSSFKYTLRLDIPDQGSNFGADNLEVGDLDGDGKPDIITGLRTNTGIISVFRNTNTGVTLTTNSFEARIDLPTNDGTISTSFINGLDLADFDGDGKQDILFGTTCLVNNVGIIRNTSTPGSLSTSDFSLPFYFEAPGCHTDVMAADVDGDGKPDIIVSRANSPLHSIYILRNTSTPGNISFEDFIEFETLNTRGRLNAADLDNDGKPEIIVGYNTDDGNDHLSIFRNASSSRSISLAVRQDFFIGTDVRPWHTAIGDFDKDGKRDIVISNRANGLSVLKNNSVTGTIIMRLDAQIPGISEGGSQPGAIQVFDMNGDGLLDIIGTVNNRAEVSVVSNVSKTNMIEDEMFAAVVSFGLPVGTSSGYSSIQIHDFNNDAKPDIVSMSRDGIWFHENKVENTPLIRGVSTYKAAIGETIIISGDFFDPTPANNIVFFGQVKATVTTTSATSLAVIIPLGAAADHITVTTRGLTAVSPKKFIPTFGPGSAFDANSFAAPINFSLGRTPQNSLAISDLDGDGKPDVVISMNNIGILRNITTPGIINTGSFAAITEISLGAASVNSIGLYDLTGDGKPDILRNSSSAPGIFQNLSAGTNPNFITFGLSIGSGVSTNQAFVGLPAGDLDEDGKIDLVYAGENQVNIVRNFQRTDTFGSTTITNLHDFQHSSNPITIMAGTVRLGGITTGDFDGDGKEDIAVVLATENKITIARNITDGPTFPIKVETFDLPSGGTDVAIETIDLDGDGKLDLIVTSQTTNLLIVYHNLSTPGNLNFQRFDFSTDNDPTLVRAADLDGDGKPELVCIYNTIQKFSVFRNISENTPQFAARVDYNLSAAPRGLAIGDIDLDGKPDVVIGLASSQSIAVFKNQLGASAVIRIDLQPSDDEVCVGEDATFSIVASGARDPQYQWQENSGSGFVILADDTQYSGTNTLTLSVLNVTASQTGNQYRCIVSGDNAQSVTSEAATLIVMVVSAPSVTDAGSCVPASVILTATGGVNGDYRWYRSLTDINPLEGEVNGTYVTPVLTETTSFYVGLVNRRCESERSTITATIGNLPAPRVNNSGPLDFCEGEFVVLRGPDGFSLYHWSDGSTTQEVEINTSVTITLRVGNEDCLSDPSEPVTTTVYPAPTQPEITLENDILVASLQPGNYQWYNADEVIEGATAHYLAINFQQFGHYTVAVSIGNCSRMSLPFTFIVTSSKEENGKKLLIYPIPFHDVLNISGISSDQEVILEIWDLNGRQQVVQEMSGSEVVRIDTQHLAAGYYVMMIYRRGKSAEKYKILKNR